MLKWSIDADAPNGEMFVNEDTPAPPAPFARPPLSKNPPVPQPGPPVAEAEVLSPTRYGDWEKGGIAIDF